jgi:hypothetical protein
MLEHLFDAELVYRSEMEPLTEDGEGKLIGSGDGTVTGPAISGQLSWTLFERPGKRVCAMNPVAVIETAEGARVRIEARGLHGARTKRAGGGPSPRRYGSKASTSVTAGWRGPSAFGRASSTPRRTVRTIRRIWGGTA